MDGATRATGRSTHAGPVKATEEPATTVLVSGATAVTRPVGRHAIPGVRNPGCGPVTWRAPSGVARPVAPHQRCVHRVPHEQVLGGLGRSQIFLPTRIYK